MAAEKQKGAAMAAHRPGVRRSVLGAILAAYFLLGGLYLATVPFGNAPDEQAHLLYVQQLAQGRLPVLRADDRANFEAHQPPLAYAIALPAYLAAGGRGGQDAPHAARYAVRVVNLLLGAGVVLLVTLAVGVCLPGKVPLAVGAAAVAAFMPMRLAVSSSFSNDPLAEVISCAVLLLLALGLRDGFDRRRCLQVGLVIGLGILTKSNCALLLPVALLALFLDWRRRGRPLLVPVLLVIGAAILVGGPWLVRNTLLYGDPLATGAFQTFFSDRAGPEYFMTRQGLTFVEYLRYRVLPFTSRSFWGVFGHMNVWMGGAAEPRPGVSPALLLRGDPEAPVYTLLEGIGVLLAIGAAVAGVRWWRRGPAPFQRDTALTWALYFALVVAAFARFNLIYFQAQARYLYPAVLPIAAAFSAGWLLPWPAGRKRLGAALLCLALVSLALYAWHGTLLRYYGKVGW